MLYFDKPWMTISFDEGLQAVHLEWKRYAEGEEFRSGFLVGLELLQQKRLCRWLGDCRLLGPMTQADQQWINEEWHPRAAAAGMRWVAIVLPRAAVARLGMTSIKSRVSHAELVMANFADLDSARDWLRSPTKPG